MLLEEIIKALSLIKQLKAVSLSEIVFFFLMHYIIIIFLSNVFADLVCEIPAQLSLEFRVFLVSAQTGNHTQESRLLQFWFISSLPDWQQPQVAQEFFKELVSPQEFPRGN